MPVAVRLPRTVAARRALLAALFLGGFLALAFLFGGSAHAADGSSGSAKVLDHASLDHASLDHASAKALGHALRPVARPQATAERVTDGPSHAVRKAEQPLRRAEPTAQIAPSQQVERIAEQTRPVERQTRRITEPVSGLVRDTADGKLPVQVYPALGAIGLGGGAHDGHAPGSVDGPHSGRTGAGAAQSGQEPGDAAHSNTLAGPVATPWPAARRAIDAAVNAQVVRATDGSAQRDGGPVPLPLPRAPLGTASQCGSGDGSGPRGGDGHAGLPPHATARFGLEPGAVRAESAAPTRQRFNEVLAFPG